MTRLVELDVPHVALATAPKALLIGGIGTNGACSSVRGLLTAPHPFFTSKK